MGLITDRQIKKSPTNKDQWLTDDAPKGHGRLTVRITPSGDRLFYFRYTDSEGKRVTMAIGKYCEEGRDGLTLAVARGTAGDLSKLYQSGVRDLKGHLEAEAKLANALRAAEQARLDADRQAQSDEAARLMARITVTDLFERWASVDLIGRKDGGKEIRRMFEKDVLPKIGHLAVDEVKKGHVTAVTDALLARSVNRMAKLIFSLMRQMFRFAVDRDIIEADPTASIRKAKIGGKGTERDRVLSEDEIRDLHRKLLDAGLLQSTECAIWVALSTCCRIGELLSARWEHVDFDRGTWRIPAENSKNAKAHTVYLSDFATQQFQRLYKITGTTAFCYPDRSGTKSVSLKTVTKQLGDRQRDGAPMSRRSSNVATLKLTGGHWTPHDLRRTGATMMTQLRVLPEVAERCLNHIEENRVKRTYQRHGYEPEMRDAWRILGERLELLIRLDDNNIAILRSVC
jgi:integrase